MDGTVVHGTPYPNAGPRLVRAIPHGAADIEAANDTLGGARDLLSERATTGIGGMATMEAGAAMTEDREADTDLWAGGACRLWQDNAGGACAGG